MKNKILILFIVLNIVIPYLYYAYLKKKKKYFYFRLGVNFFECFFASLGVTAILIPGVYIVLGIILSFFINVKSIKFFKDLWFLYNEWGAHLCLLIMLFGQINEIKFKYKKLYNERKNKRG